MSIKPRKLLLELNRSCNLRCGYCYHAYKQQPGHAPVNRFRLPATFLRRLRIEEIVLSGGEPLLDPSLVLELIDYYRKYSSDIELVTNGTLLSSALLQELWETGLTRLAVSLDTLDPELHKKIRGGSNTPVLRNLHEICRFADHSLELTLIVVLSAHNCTLSNINSILTFAEDLDISRVRFQPVTTAHLPQAKAMEFALPDKLALFETLNKMDHPKIVFSPQFMTFLELLDDQDFFDPFFCPIAQQLVYLDFKGRMSSCPIRTDLTFNCWDDYGNFKEELANRRCDITSLISCRLQTHCLCLF